MPWWDGLSAETLRELRARFPDRSFDQIGIIAARNPRYASEFERLGVTVWTYTGMSIRLFCTRRTTLTTSSIRREAKRRFGRSSWRQRSKTTHRAASGEALLSGPMTARGSRLPYGCCGRPRPSRAATKPRGRRACRRGRRQNHQADAGWHARAKSEPRVAGNSRRFVATPPHIYLAELARPRGIPAGTVCARAAGRGGWVTICCVSRRRVTGQRK
jgi:hypothetical protein